MISKINKLHTFSVIILILLANSTMTLAQEQQEIKLKLNFTAVSELITVQSLFNQTDIIPNYEYESLIDVNWSIPDNAVEGLTANKVVVFVSTKINENSTGIYFKELGKQAKEVYFILNCQISNSNCNSSSILSRSIPFYLKINDTTMSITNSDVFEIKASLTPFGEYGHLVNETTVFYKILEQIRNSTNSLDQTDENVRTVLDMLNSVENKLEVYNTENVSTELNEANETITKIGESKDLLEKIKSLETIVDELRLKLSTTTNPDLESTLNELEESLERAKNLTAALETKSAADRISNVEKEIDNLNKPKEIGLPQLDFSSINPYYLIVPIVFVLLIAIILIKFRGKENKGL